MAAGTILHGKGGTVSWSTDTAAFVVNEGMTSWTMNIVGDTADTTSVDDTSYVGRVGTWKSWTASVDTIDAGYAEAVLFAALGDEAELACKDGSDSQAGTGGNTYTGTGILVGFSKSMDINGIFTVSWLSRVQEQ